MFAMWLPLIIILLIFLVPWESSGKSPNYVAPIQILRERYARGEIDAEEFRSKRRELGG